MIDSLSVWVSEYEKLPQDLTGNESPTNIANFINERVTGKLDLSDAIAKFSPPPSFTWEKGLFENLFRIVTKTPSPDPLSPAIKIATAWQTATQASTVVITVGATINPPPAGTNGVVGNAVALVDPVSIAAAYSSLLADLISSTPSQTKAQAKLPKALYKAFTMLTITITGVDTKPPPIGPIPFALPMTPVI